MLIKLTAGDGKYDRRGTSLVKIGERIFALGGGYNPATSVIEVSK
jgi:hypothetical protein